MQTVTSGYRSLRLLVTLNRDRLIYGAMITGALGGGSWIGTLFT